MLASAALSSPGFLADSVEDEFELSTVCHRPEGLEQLQEQTKFTRKELQVLYRGFKNVSTPRPALLAPPPLPRPAQRVLCTRWCLGFAKAFGTLGLKFISGYGLIPPPGSSVGRPDPVLHPLGAESPLGAWDAEPLQ